jgi:hypothetical protein
VAMLSGADVSVPAIVAAIAGDAPRAA